jgi:glycine hydroxymethyltransferase
MKDKEVENLIKAENERQARTLNLIASENYVSRDVLDALGSIFTNKYAEGYPGARYYGGNSIVDELENLARKRALDLFGLSSDAWSVNVQPYSGSPANIAIYLALVPKGEKIMGMQLDMGGHLTHGHSVNASGMLWQQVPYGVREETELLDYEEIKNIATRERPKLIVAGSTAYSRIIDFQRFREIADAANALLMVDMSHFAGLVAGEVYPSPFPYADVVMTTMHKTLRGPRSAVIFSQVEFAAKIDKAVFPGFQGGPHANQIAAAAVALEEAAQPKFKKYAHQVVTNAKVLASELAACGWRIVSGGTDSHLFLVDTISGGVSGKMASDLLEAAGIIVNKNTIPYDARKPADPSGIRIGTPAITTRGMREAEMKEIASLIDAALKGKDSKDILQKVTTLLQKFPLP